MFRSIPTKVSCKLHPVKAVPTRPELLTLITPGLILGFPWTNLADMLDFRLVPSKLNLVKAIPESLVTVIFPYRAGTTRLPYAEFAKIPKSPLVPTYQNLGQCMLLSWVTFLFLLLGSTNWWIWIVTPSWIGTVRLSTSAGRSAAI